MKKRVKRLFCVLFVLMFALHSFAAASAAGVNAPEPAPKAVTFTNIASYSCSCYISGLKIYMNASLTAKSSMSLSITIELQKLKSGDYGTIETWSDSKTAVSMSLDPDRLINLLSTYRIKVTFNAGGESVTSYAYP